MCTKFFAGQHYAFSGRGAKNEERPVLTAICYQQLSVSDQPVQSAF
jgi:hypothetical protein